MDFQTFKSLFVEERRRLEIPQDTFAVVLARTHEKYPGFRKLKTREWDTLHGLNLKALSAALQHRATGAVRVSEV